MPWLRDLRASDSLSFGLWHGALHHAYHLSLMLVSPDAVLPQAVDVIFEKKPLGFRFVRSLHGSTVAPHHIGACLRVADLEKVSDKTPMMLARFGFRFFRWLNRL